MIHYFYANGSTFLCQLLKEGSYTNIKSAENKAVIMLANAKNTKIAHQYIQKYVESDGVYVKYIIIADSIIRVDSNFGMTDMVDPVRCVPAVCPLYYACI